VTGIPIDFLKLKRLATLWFEGNPVEFPPPPIPDLGFKRLFAWLRQSRSACETSAPDEEASASDDFKRMDSQSSTRSFSRIDSGEWSQMGRVASDQGGKSQRNDLWWKLANRRSADPVAEEEEQKRAKVREQCRLYRHGRQVLDLNFHPEIPILATSSEDCTVKLWEQNPVSLISFPLHRNSYASDCE